MARKRALGSDESNGAPSATTGTSWSSRLLYHWICVPRFDVVDWCSVSGGSGVSRLADHGLEVRGRVWAGIQSQRSRR